jgi:hypothetical protein
MLEQVDDALWIAERENVSFYGDVVCPLKSGPP